MKETLEKFWLKDNPDTPTNYQQESEIHVMAFDDVMGLTLCGERGDHQYQEYTDKMPTCSTCLGIYNYIKNGKLRK